MKITMLGREAAWNAIERFERRESNAAVNALRLFFNPRSVAVIGASRRRGTIGPAEPQVRVAAIRTSESLYKAGDKSLVPDVTLRLKDPDPGVVIPEPLPTSLCVSGSTVLIMLRRKARR